ncbi:MAG: zinc-ribbon domain-containing protein [Deltaproteobacteria bacterium]|jgi:DNA-directed RNA polymerase subunit RPC12/RpoP|nr:zinc-ribbon domain-containing protein [Deltaproteobacteria bacterium]
MTETNPDSGPNLTDFDSTQIVVCPKCQTKYRLSIAIPDNGLTFPCSKCRTTLLIRPKPPQLEPTEAKTPPLVAPDPGVSQNAICPSCLKPVAVNLTNDQDRWVVCPSCGEKFVAPANPAWVTLGDHKVAADFKPTRAKSRLVLNVDKMAQVYEIGLPERAPGHRRKMIMAVSALLLLGLGLYGYLILSSWREATSLVENSPTPTGVGAVNYTEDDFKKDLFNFHRWGKNKFFSNYVVNYSSDSSRFFKYAISKLAPNECQEFTSLTLNSTRHAGVSVKGHCFEERLADPILQVDWQGQYAVLSVPAVNREIFRVPIFPISSAQDGR